MKTHILRLQPGEDLLGSLFRWARATQISAASIVSAVGSLDIAAIRFANQSYITTLQGPFEVVSLMGNLDRQSNPAEGSGHVHISVSNGQGETFGGHLWEGSIIFTTMELTLLELPHGLFLRVPDLGKGGSGYDELQVFKIGQSNQPNSPAVRERGNSGN